MNIITMVRSKGVGLQRFGLVPRPHPAAGTGLGPRRAPPCSNSTRFAFSRWRQSRCVLRIPMTQPTRVSD